MNEFFPYKKIRKHQDKLLSSIESTFESGKCMVVHAPTGLGKTVAALSPALAVAKEKKLTVFFLTSRHTQHLIAIKTLMEIKEKLGSVPLTVDIVGKRWMCLAPGAETLLPRDFSEYCKALRANKTCEWFSNTKKASGVITQNAKKAIEDLKLTNPNSSEDIISYCDKNKLCPYEIATELAKEAKIVISDYNYLFNESISKSFFLKTEKDKSGCIAIVDEAHNIPNRIRDMLSARLSNAMILRAIKEAKKNGFLDVIEYLTIVQDALNELSKGFSDNEERMIKKEDFFLLLGPDEVIEDIIENLQKTADEIRLKQRQSYVGSVADFLETWRGSDTGFIRIIAVKKGLKYPLTMISYRCLDPSLATIGVISSVYSIIFMSGTLNPTSMYCDVLGCPKDTVELTLPSPFKDENRLNIIIPKTTTKFSQRSEKQFKEIAKICSEVCNSIPGNVAVFFPSYQILENVKKDFSRECDKTIFVEHKGISKSEKTAFIERFKSYKDSGAALLAVISANFSEGIDLPGDLLKGVVIVGLPLQPPDLETKELIKYYDSRFGRGWDYAYIFPAFERCLQGAGRCIRTEKDRGVIVFIDERFAWPQYRKNFPQEQEYLIVDDFNKEIKKFFTLK